MKTTSSGSTSRSGRATTAARYCGIAAACTRAFKAVLAALAASLILSGCDPCRRCVTPAGVTETVHTRDTVTVTVTVRDTVAVVRLVPEAAASVAATADTARAETSYAVAAAWLAGNGICLTITNKDTAEAMARTVERLTERLRETTQRVDRVEVRRERYVPAVVRWLAWAGGASIAAGVFFVFFRVSARFR